MKRARKDRLEVWRGVLLGCTGGKLWSWDNRFIITIAERHAVVISDGPNKELCGNASNECGRPLPPCVFPLIYQPAVSLHLLLPFLPLIGGADQSCRSHDGMRSRMRSLRLVGIGNFKKCEKPEIHRRCLCTHKFNSGYRPGGRLVH